MRRMLLGLSLALSLAMPAIGQPLAVVVGLDGTVEMLMAGKQAWEPAVVHAGLAAGDRLRVVSGKATLLQSDGRTRTLSSGEETTVAGQGPAVAEEGPLWRLWQAFTDRAALAVREAQPSKAGGVRLPAGYLDLVSPRNSGLLAAPIEIAWLPVEGAQRYRVLVCDSRGRPIVRQDVEGPRLDLTPFQDRFRPGVAYFVKVSDLRPAGTSSHKVYFRVMTEEIRKTVLADMSALERTLGGRTDPQVAALERGTLYEHWGLLDDALRAYRQAGAAPGPALKQAIGLLYVRNGRRWAAQE